MCVLPNVFLIIVSVARALEVLVLSCEIERHTIRCVYFCDIRFRPTKQVTLAFKEMSKNVWHDTRNCFSARKLPNTTEIVVSATRTASCFRSTKIVLRASRHPQTLRIQWFERLGAFRSLNTVHSALAGAQPEASEAFRRSHVWSPWNAKSTCFVDRKGCATLLAWALQPPWKNASMWLSLDENSTSSCDSSFWCVSN